MRYKSRKSSKDFTNIQWANRLGRRVTARTGTEVVGGTVNAIGSDYIIIEKSRIKRSDIICIRGEN